MSSLSETGTIRQSIDIPMPISMQGWKDIPINEIGDELVSLNALSFPRLLLSPQYHAQGIEHASTEMNLRKGAAERLRIASSLLPPGLSLVIFDAHRPLAVQQSLFDKFKLELSIRSPGATEDELIALTEQYVSIPSSDPSKPSPHATGGAIDLSIASDDGTLLDMGTEWDSFNIESQSAYLKNSNPEAHRNRKLLYDIMTTAGFTNYPEEWWHYDFGNQFWAHLSGNNAIYGLAQLKEVNNMDRTERTESQPALTEIEGPFVLYVSGPIAEGSSTERSARYILGGPAPDADQRFAAAQELIATSSATTFDQRRQEASQILADNNLQRVDH